MDPYSSPYTSHYSSFHVFCTPSFPATQRPVWNFMAAYPSAAYSVSSSLRQLVWAGKGHWVPSWWIGVLAGRSRASSLSVSKIEMLCVFGAFLQGQGSGSCLDRSWHLFVHALNYNTLGVLALRVLEDCLHP